MLGEADAGRKLSNLRHQLHAPRLSGALVSGIASLHVSVSRRCFLRRRFTCIGAAAARPLRIQVQDRERTIVGRGWPASDAVAASLSRVMIMIERLRNV